MKNLISLILLLLFFNVSAQEKASPAGAIKGIAVPKSLLATTTSEIILP